MLPLLLALAAPPSINDAIRQAINPCADVKPGEITVCGKDQARERARYGVRQPDKGFDPNGPVDSVSRERHRLLDNGGDATMGSCSAVGASGATGCLLKGWRDNQYQRGW